MIENNGSSDPDMVELRPMTGSQKKIYQPKKLSPTSENTYRFFRNQAEMGIAGRSIQNSPGFISLGDNNNIISPQVDIKMLGENSLRQKGGYNSLISPKQYLLNTLTKHASAEKGVGTVQDTSKEAGEDGSQ